MSGSVLIVECANEACRKDGAIDAQHNDSGRREWTTAFTSEAATNAAGWAWWPVEGEGALKCPDCGEMGTVIAY